MGTIVSPPASVSSEVVSRRTSSQDHALRVFVKVIKVLVRRGGLLLILLALVYAAVDLLPGDAARVALDPDATEAQIAARSTALGLDDPLPLRFANWIGGIFTGDLGTTTLGAPIGEVLGSRLPNTALLAVLALIVTTILAVVGGSIWMLRPHGIVAKILSPLTMMLLALPEFVVAIFLVLIFSLWLGWLPAVTIANSAGAPAGWSMLVLPVLALALPTAAWNIQVVRSALIDAASAPHVEAAILDGYPKWHVLVRHILPISIPTIAASISTTTAMLFGGALVVEAVFNYPGVGSLMAGSVSYRDTTLAATIVAVSAIAIMVVLFVADLLRNWATRGRA